uniref:NACHT domain-containing protein n=1 Tax=Candidatus Kentrum sp. UNK TaxID=2126344 RepID=A0A450ZZ72_9GAMM|nr:MAG: NACHT domain-containing protein [Candidatus Kentron sp. UNK]VFK72953.1 MAG: NACHT domain-containing protein [Candidatus Kentron sp. UNK]
MPTPNLSSQESPLSLLDRVVNIIANPNPEQIAVGIISALAASLIIWLAIRASRGLSTLFWAFTARLSAAPALSRIVTRSYLRQVRKNFGTVRNIYLDRQEQLDLHRVFMPLTLRSRSDQDQIENPEIRAPQTTREILTENPHIVILGAPGSGKTTPLKALASGISQHQWSEWQTLVPVFVSLRAFSRATDEPSLHHWLIHTLLPEEYNLRYAEPLLNKLLSRGRMLLLLDGLDEVNVDDQSSVLTRIAGFLEKYASNGSQTVPRRHSASLLSGWRMALGLRSAATPSGWRAASSHILLTCREQNYDLISDALLLRHQGMAEYRLADMRDGEVDAMVQSRQEDFERHNKAIPRFLDAIRANERIYQLTPQPPLANPVHRSLSPPCR